MAKYKLTKAEQETILLWDEEEKTVRIETYDKRLMRALEKSAKEDPNDYRKFAFNEYGGITCECPRSLLRVCFAKPMTDEQKKHMSDLAKERDAISATKKP